MKLELRLSGFTETGIRAQADVGGVAFGSCEATDQKELKEKVIHLFASQFTFRNWDVENGKIVAEAENVVRMAEDHLMLGNSSFSCIETAMDLSDAADAALNPADIARNSKRLYFGYDEDRNVRLVFYTSKGKWVSAYRTTAGWIPGSAPRTFSEADNSWDEFTRRAEARIKE